MDHTPLPAPDSARASGVLNAIIDSPWLFGLALLAAVALVLVGRRSRELLFLGVGIVGFALSWSLLMWAVTDTPRYATQLALGAITLAAALAVRRWHHPAAPPRSSAP